MDNSIVAYDETIHSIKISKRWMGWVALKFDMSKAYNLIECELLSRR